MDALLIPRFYYTIKEAAIALRSSKVTLYRKTKSGEIPCRYEGRKVLIPADYIEQHKRSPAPEPQATAPVKNKGGRPRKLGPDWAQ